MSTIRYAFFFIIQHASFALCSNCYPVFLGPLWLQLVENCMCLLRNLSYQVHREIPGSERYMEAMALNQGPPPTNKGGCFGSRKGKGSCRMSTRVSLLSKRLFQGVPMPICIHLQALGNTRLGQ